MGYDLHITRADEWMDSESAPIALEEWLAYVASDPEMRLEGAAEAHTPAGDTLRCESPGLATWTAWPSADDETGPASFEHREGRVVVKNADEAIIRKMCAIAEKLGARVFGDDGEEYPETAPPPAPDRPWWRKIFGG